MEKLPDFKLRDEGYYITFMFQTYRAYKRYKERIGERLALKYDSLRNCVSLCPDDYVIMFAWIECEKLELDPHFV